MGSNDIGSNDIGSNDIGSNDIGSNDIGSNNIGFIDLEPFDLGFNEIGSINVGSNDIRSNYIFSKTACFNIHLFFYNFCSNHINDIVIKTSTHYNLENLSNLSFKGAVTEA
jgi:hypothetical protein